MPFIGGMPFEDASLVNHILYRYSDRDVRGDEITYIDAEPTAVDAVASETSYTPPDYVQDSFQDDVQQTPLQERDTILRLDSSPLFIMGGAVLTVAVFALIFVTLRYRTASKASSDHNETVVRVTKEQLVIRRVNDIEEDTSINNNAAAVLKASTAGTLPPPLSLKERAAEYQRKASIHPPPKAPARTSVQPKPRSASISDGLPQGISLRDYLKRLSGDALPQHLEIELRDTLDDDNEDSSAESSSSSMESIDEEEESDDNDQLSESNDKFKESTKQEMQEVVKGWLPHRFDELALSPGDKVLVSCVYEDGWCDGKILGTAEHGVFPLACLKCHSLQESNVNHSSDDVVSLYQGS